MGMIQTCREAIQGRQGKNYSLGWITILTDIVLIIYVGLMMADCVRLCRIAVEVPADSQNTNDDNDKDRDEESFGFLYFFRPIREIFRVFVYVLRYLLGVFNSPKQVFYTRPLSTSRDTLSLSKLIRSKRTKKALKMSFGTNRIEVQVELVIIRIVIDYTTEGYSNTEQHDVQRECYSDKHKLKIV